MSSTIDRIVKNNKVTKIIIYLAYILSFLTLMIVLLVGKTFSFYSIITIDFIIIIGLFIYKMKLDKEFASLLNNYIKEMKIHKDIEVHYSDVKPYFSKGKYKNIRKSVTVNNVIESIDKDISLK